MSDPKRDDDAQSPPSGEPPVHVGSLRFNDGTVLPLEPGHVVVLVGANNVGKSSALRDIAGALRSEGHSRHRVVTDVQFAEAPGHPGPLRDWVRRRFPKYRPNPNSPMMFGTAQASVNETQLDEEPLRPQTLRQIRRVVTFVADAQQRLSLTNPSPPFDSRRSGPQTPIQALFNNTEKVEELSEASLAAFGVALTYGHNDGHWRLRLGVPEVNPAVTGRHLFPTPETREAIEALEVVEDQGDGLRSYLGVLLELLAARHVFVVLDEPEAFLHPPQARQLASTVLQVKPEEAQLFVATHDSNFVRGLLNVADVRLSIVRITREGDSNPVCLIDPATISEVARDPVLRHSTILDSIFHTYAIVCEAEADCLLYEAVSEDLQLVEPGSTFHFVGSSGKHRVRRTCELLGALGVSAAAVVDFDVLKSESEVRDLLQALRQDDSAIGGLLTRVCAQLEDLGKGHSITNGALLDRITGILEGEDQDSATSSLTRRKVADLARSSGEWSELKRNGIDATKGDLHAEVRELVENLAQRRLHVVPKGELESWFRDAPSKGASHVAHILENGWHTDGNRNREIAAFVSSIVEGLSKPAALFPDGSG